MKNIPIFHPIMPFSLKKVYASETSVQQRGSDSLRERERECDDEQHCVNIGGRGCLPITTA